MTWNIPSRFIEEAGLSPQEELVEEKISAPGDWQIGNRVRHEDLGDGEILEKSGDQGDAKILILFDNGEWRKFMVKQVSLELLEQEAS